MNELTTNENFFASMEKEDGGVSYDFFQGFWKNYEKLSDKIPFPNVIHIVSENSDFADIIGWSKNIYLSFIVMESENVFYSY